MKNIMKFVELVKGQSDFHVRMANKYSSEPKRYRLHMETAEKFGELYDFLVELQNKRIQGPPKLALSWDEIANLPPELVAELSISDTDKTEFNVLTALEEAGGVASLDRILIGYYRITGEVMKRSQMNNRIYRMIQKEMIFPVPGKKGVYSISQLSDEELSELA